MKRLNYRQLMILDEVLIIAFISWILFMLAEFIKLGLVSNYYDLNLHFIIVIVLLVFRILQRAD